MQPAVPQLLWWLHLFLLCEGLLQHSMCHSISSISNHFQNNTTIGKKWIININEFDYRKFTLHWTFEMWCSLWNVSFKNKTFRMRTLKGHSLITWCKSCYFLLKHNLNVIITQIAVKTSGHIYFYYYLKVLNIKLLLKLLLEFI